MFDTVKNLNKIREEAKKTHNVEYDDQNREVVRIQVNTDDDFLSPYCRVGEETISGDVAEFLDNAVKPLDIRNDLHIIISEKTIDDNEKIIYSAAIKNYYRSRVIDISRRLKVNTAASIIMACIAAAIFVLYAVLEQLSAGYIVMQFTDIAAWVFSWEAIDLFFLERSLLRHEQRRDCGLYAAEVSFEHID